MSDRPAVLSTDPCHWLSIKIKSTQRVSSFFVSRSTIFDAIDYTNHFQEKTVVSTSPSAKIKFALSRAIFSPRPFFQTYIESKYSADQNLAVSYNKSLQEGKGGGV